MGAAVVLFWDVVMLTTRNLQSLHRWQCSEMLLKGLVTNQPVP